VARMVKNISCVGQAAEAIRAELEALNRFDIRISRVIALSDTTTGLVNMFAAQVSYKWRLNAWDKEVKDVVCGLVFSKSDNAWHLVEGLSGSILEPK